MICRSRMLRSAILLACALCLAGGDARAAKTQGPKKRSFDRRPDEHLIIRDPRVRGGGGDPIPPGTGGKSTLQ